MMLSDLPRFPVSLTRKASLPGSGYNLGNHMLASAKMQPYDHSLRIPMLFAGPGIKRGSQLDWLGTQVDLAPTILALAGIPTPSDMDGRSIVPLV